jgi:hypothetical protein
MKIITLLLTIFLLTACGGDGKPFEYTKRISEPVCTDETIAQRAEFTLQCITNANPKSDEEPEDWLHKCEDMAVSLYCKDVYFDEVYITRGSKKDHYNDKILSKTQVTVYEVKQSSLIGIVDDQEKPVEQSDSESVKKSDENI